MQMTVRTSSSSAAAALSGPFSLWHHVRLLWERRELLLVWTRRELSVRYKQSLIGGLWAVLQPVSLMLIFTFVFSFLTRVPTDGTPYPVFSYAGLLPWVFLSNSLSFAVPSLVNNMNLVTKVYFPREILPIGNVGAALVDFGLSAAVFVVMMLFYRVSFTWALIWIPVLLVIQSLLVLGVVLFLAAVNVFYRDIRFVIPMLTQVWMYATPVIYPVSVVPDRLRGIYMLNPMAGLVESYRRVALTGRPPEPEYLATSTLLSVLIFLLGYAYFKHSEATFADLI